MRRLIVIALTIVLALGLSVGVASAWAPHPTADWASWVEGFSYGNFTAGGTIFGSSPGYPEFANTGYVVEAGVSIVAGLKDPGRFYLVSQGAGGGAGSDLKVEPYQDCEGWHGTWGKTIEAFQRLQQTGIVTGDSLVTTEMYSGFELTDYPRCIVMKQKIDNLLGWTFPHVSADQTGQYLHVWGWGPGYASMYTTTQKTTRAGPGAVESYGLLGADLAQGKWGIEGWQIVEYDPDGAPHSGYISLLGYF